MEASLHLKTLSVLAASILGASAAWSAPAAPGNLKADVNGLIVDLTWDWGNTGACILNEGFEDETFPPAGWEIERGYTMGEIGNWIRYTFEPEDDETLAHSGCSTAMLMMADEYDEEDPTTMHQDEWLIVKPGAGAEYMEFWYFLHPELLYVGGFRDFPDHYYVKISRDNGDTWTELWDGRWDMGDTDQVQPAALFLGEPADDNTLVAFNAVSGEEESLYFLWAVDDVQFYTASEAGALRPRLSTRERHALPEGVRTHRPYAPAPAAHRMARLSESEWLNAGQTTFRIYLDDKVVADYVKRLNYTDYNSKDKGTHTFRVMAWNEATDTEYASASVDVEIGDFYFLAPTQVKGYWTEEKDGKFQIEVGWEGPDSDQQPSYYNVYVNDKNIGRADMEEYPYFMGQTGLPKGAYKFGVEAVYELPEGKSEIVETYVFPGTRVTPVALTVADEGESHLLSWTMPQIEEEYDAPEAFHIYRGQELIGKVDDGSMRFTAADAPQGKYTYAVHAIYADGAVSLPATAAVTKGEPVMAELPIFENFDSAHLPAGWDVELVDPFGRVKEMYAWRFDNWFGLTPDPASGIAGGFASISCADAGLNLVESYLYTPEFEIPAEGETLVAFNRWHSEEEIGPSGPALCEMQISTDGGENWKPLVDLKTTDIDRLSISLADYAGKRAAVRWGVKGRASGILAIDNVAIGDASVLSVGGVAVDSACSHVDLLTPAGVVLRRGMPVADISTLPAGLYIVRQPDGRASKVMIR